MMLREKTLMLGEIDGKRRRGQQRTRLLDSVTDSMDMNLRKPEESGGQKSQACCSPWSCKESDMAKWLSSNDSYWKWLSSLQSLSRVWLFATPWIAAHQASLSITNSQSLLRLTFIESVMPSNHPILCHPLLLPLIFPSIRVFFNESALRIRWPKYWSFSFIISPSNEHSGLISFRIDWLDLQGTLKSLLQHHNSKASILQHSAFVTVQLSHPYVTTGKSIALTRWSFVSKVMSLLF